MIKADRVFAVICLGISLWLILESSNYNYTVRYTPGPGFFPFWLGIVLSLFSTALVVETFLKKGGNNRSEPGRLPERQALYRVGGITLLTAGFALVMTSLGFVLTVICFVAAILYFLERVALVRSLLTGLIMSSCIYLIFEYWMQIGLPAGRWGF
jgi:putative tricarboxylic transport membrane protein